MQEITLKTKILRKIQDKRMVVAIIGLGYVGLPLAVESAKAGYETIGIDTDIHKIDSLYNRQSYIKGVNAAELAEFIESERIKAATDFSIIREADFIMICVPTPLEEHKQPDISYVREAVQQVSKYMKRGTTIVLESTTYPGTTEELLLPILEKNSGLKCGEDFYLAFSPERVDPGNKQYNTGNTSKVVGGVNKDSTEVAVAMYKQLINSEIHAVSSAKVAEMEKILENTYRNINIGLANEMAIICEKMGINVWEVIEAAQTKPYGFQAFYPGPGIGGHCIPLDPYYLSWKVREYDYHTKLIETSGDINNYMPQYIVERTVKILNRHRKTLNGANILILGVAYKPNIDDYRESAALKIIDLLKKEGAQVSFYDPHIEKYTNKGKEYFGLLKLEKDDLKKADLAIITVKHSSFALEYILENCENVFDTCNATKNVKEKSNVELL